MKRIAFLVVLLFAASSLFAWEPSGRKNTFTVDYPVPLYWEPGVEGMDWSAYAPVVEEIALPEEEEAPEPVFEASEEVFEAEEVAQSQIIGEDDVVVFYGCCVLFILIVMTLSVVMTQKQKRR